MATTVNVIITRALRLLSQINSGIAPTVGEQVDALFALNAMLDSWRNDRIMCYALQEEAITLVQGVSTYAIGPTGAIVTTRPVKIESARVDVGTISYEVKKIEEHEFANISVKTQQRAYPLKFWYQPLFPNGVVNLWPVPGQAATLYVSTWVPVLAFATINDTVSLPPGWEQAITTNLAVEMAPEYEMEAPATVKNMALTSLKRIKRLNARTVRMYFDSSLSGGASFYSNGNPI